MVFSEFIDNITGHLSSEKKNIQVELNESQAINELQQGMILLNNRKKSIHKLKNKLLLIENFDTTKVDNVSQNELNILSSLENKYQTKLSAYSTAYKAFMADYYQAVKDVRTC